MDGLAVPELNVVTGAFSFSGSFIAERLLAERNIVRTLTGHPDRKHPLRDRVEVAPFDFENRDQLIENLRGATTLYNTYWIRFPRGPVTFDTAVENTKRLLHAAAEAGVRRVVHLSVTNPSEDSPFPYFRAKAQAEELVVWSGLSYAIVRPTLIFGPGGVLINNIAWMLRRLPVFVVAGSGNYKVQPLFVGDLAEIAVAAGQRRDNIVVDAIGPETHTFDEFIQLIARSLSRRGRIIHPPPALAVLMARMVGLLMRDVVTALPETQAMMSNLLISDSEPTGHTRLGDWLERNVGALGIRYISDLKRHYR